MSPGRSTATAIIGGYNLVQNLALPSSAYVPANIVVSAGLVALARRQGCSWDDLGLAPARAEKGVGLGLATTGVLAAGAATALFHPSLRRRLLDQRAADQDHGDILYHVLVRFPLGTALFEEAAFRGAVVAIWKNDGATEFEAVTAASIMFGLWHLIPTRAVLDRNPTTAGIESALSRTGAVLMGAVVTGLASLALSWMRRCSGSLIAPWMAHAAFNSAGYLAGVAAWRLIGRTGNGVRSGSFGFPDN